MSSPLGLVGPERRSAGLSGRDVPAYNRDSHPSMVFTGMRGRGWSLGGQGTAQASVRMCVDGPRDQVVQELGGQCVTRTIGTVASDL